MRSNWVTVSSYLKKKIKKKAQKKEKGMGEKETVDGRDKNTR